jgi:succinate dehydrogenase/fumarate reductase cytochrome b subunit
LHVAPAPSLNGLPSAVTSRFNRTLPSLAAIAYPGLIWSGPAIGPIFLAISLGVPIVGLLIAHRVDHRVHPRSRWIAFAVVGTPPVYSLLGGWLDFQRVVPFKGLHVWFAIWLASACIAFWERPSHRPGAGSQPAQGRLAFAHGISALLITCFAAAHLVNHLGGLWGGERHTAIMHILRLVYRHPIVETVLLASITFQMLSGLILLQRKLPHAISWIDSLQAASAVYLAMFFLSHVSAVLRTRLLRHVDTGWTWASDGLLTDPWSARLAPYYFLAVIALGIHGAAGVRRVMLHHGQSARRAERTFSVVVAGAAALSVAIMTGLIRG